MFISTSKLLWDRRRELRRLPCGKTGRSVNRAKLWSEFQSPPPLLQPAASVPALLSLYLFPGPASFPVSLLPWLLSLFLSRAPLPSFSAPGSRAACCLPAAGGTPQCCAALHL